MRAVEFIEMQKQDIETHKDKATLAEIVAAMSAAVANSPEAEIDPAKTAEECYKQMYDHAKKHQKSGYYFFGMNETMSFVRKYLGLPETSEIVSVSVPETKPAPIQEPVSTKKRRSLEEFF